MQCAPFIEILTTILFPLVETSRRSNRADRFFDLQSTRSVTCNWIHIRGKYSHPACILHSPVEFVFITFATFYDSIPWTVVPSTYFTTVGNAGIVSNMDQCYLELYGSRAWQTDLFLTGFHRALSTLDLQGSVLHSTPYAGSHQEVLY